MSTRSTKEDFEKIKLYANTCRTRRHFFNLLRRFRTYVPYRGLVFGWGYHPDFVLAFWDHDDYPLEYLRYYIQDSVLQKDPIFAEWLRTQRCQVWKDVVERVGASTIDPTYLRMTREHGLEHTLAGGSIDEGITCFFALAMLSDGQCHEYLHPFEVCINDLCQAMRRAFPRPRLSPQQVDVLTRLRRGYTVDEIADQLKIKPGTVHAHLKKVKNTLEATTTLQALSTAQATEILTSQPSWSILYPRQHISSS